MFRRIVTGVAVAVVIGCPLACMASRWVAAANPSVAVRHCPHCCSVPPRQDQPPHSQDSLPQDRLPQDNGSCLCQGAVMAVEVKVPPADLATIAWIGLLDAALDPAVGDILAPPLYDTGGAGLPIVSGRMLRLWIASLRC